MEALPLSLRLAGQPCLVVGGGEVARRKIDLLLRADAHVRTVAVEVCAGVAELAEGGALTLQRRAFRAEDVEDCLLVVAATDDDAVNDAVTEACEQRRVLLNRVDDGVHSTAIFPAIVDRSPVTVAVSTGGASPTLARRLREQIEALLPESLGRAAAGLARVRGRVRAALPDVAARRRFWDDAFDGELASVLEGAVDVEEQVDRALAAASSGDRASGLVSLVGAGPGNADLLTIKALRCLQRADVVYYDNLVADDVLDRCRRDASRVYVGRRPDDKEDANVRERRIQAELVADARRGRRVVRLKGGDPFIFGRGGEEAAALTQAGVDFEVVPGVTAALGCAAYAGIPLTQRGLSTSVRLIAGRSASGGLNLTDDDWHGLARPDQTLVVYMGLATLAVLCERLLAAGAAPDTPAATVSRATLADQRIVLGTLADLPDRVREAALPTPTTTIIGAVAGLARDPGAGLGSPRQARSPSG